MLCSQETTSENKFDNFYIVSKRPKSPALILLKSSIVFLFLVDDATDSQQVQHSTQTFQRQSSEPIA